MIRDIEKIRKAREIILNLANGVDPINEIEIKTNDVLSDPRIIRCFFFIGEVLDGVAKGEYSKGTKGLKFIITPEQKANVVFTGGEIGVNEISKCINEQLNPLLSKRTAGSLINKGLKKMKILSEREDPDGKIRTTINEKSAKYGFIEVQKTFNGDEYTQVLANDLGKNFILDNIDEIMNKSSKNN